MRSPSLARWPICAFALCSLVSTVTAQKKKGRSVGDCAAFDQRDRADEDGVDFTVDNRCDVKLSCGIKWSVTCAPGTRKAKSKKGGVAFTLEADAVEAVTASAEHCGFAGWEIKDISWSCEPVR
jgi:hypothetical protein